MANSPKTAESGNFGLNSWSQLADIEAVSDALTSERRAFLKALGSILASRRQTSRIGVTLLHSHFRMRSDECLVEEADEKRGLLVTTVKPLNDVLSNKDYVPNSWMFHETPTVGDLPGLEPLTWRSRTELPQRTLDRNDSELVVDLARTFRGFSESETLGLTLVGELADPGKLWTEAADLEERRLIQEQLPMSEVEQRDPIKTVWVFDETGEFTITRGCCYKYANGNGHTGIRHPRG